MANTPQKVDINCETGEVTYTDLTAEEIAQREADAKAAATAQAKADADAKALADLKASAISKLVAGTPLTEEEAKTLVV
jgi:hypothetical protein